MSGVTALLRTSTLTTCLPLTASSVWSSSEVTADFAIGAYNAGAGNVNRWLRDNGDPRYGSVDWIDWIERIPISETRNYVQRIIENMQVYRARFDNNPRLLIEADLRRGG